MSEKMREALLGQKLGNIISGYRINADDADWLRGLLAEQPAKGVALGWGLAAFQHKWEACETQCECKVCGTVFTAAPSPQEKAHYNYLDNFCKHCGYDHSVGPLCNALKAERLAAPEIKS